MHVAPRIFSTTFNLFWDIFSGTLLSPTSLINIYVFGTLFGRHFWNTFLGHFLWPLSTQGLSTVPGCTWLCLGLPCSNLPQTATDWLKLFCIYRLKCSKAISGTERDKWDGNLCYKHCSASISTALDKCLKEKKVKVNHWLHQLWKGK